MAHTHPTNDEQTSPQLRAPSAEITLRSPAALPDPVMSTWRTISSDSDTDDDGEDDYTTEDIDELESSDAPSTVPAKRKANTPPSQRKAARKTNAAIAPPPSQPELSQKEDNTQRYRSRSGSPNPMLVEDSDNAPGLPDPMLVEDSDDAQVDALLGRSAGISVAADTVPARIASPSSIGVAHTLATPLSDPLAAPSPHASVPSIHVTTAHASTSSTITREPSNTHRGSGRDAYETFERAARAPTAAEAEYADTKLHRISAIRGEMEYLDIRIKLLREDRAYLEDLLRKVESESVSGSIHDPGDD